MDTIESMFENYLNNSYYDAGDISGRLYFELRKAFYAGFSRCGIVYEKEIKELSEIEAKKELASLKHEFASFAGAVDEIHKNRGPDD